MKPRTLWVLIALAAGLGAFLWFVDRELPSSEERRERNSQLLSLEVDQVQSLEIQNQSEGGGSLRIERVLPVEASAEIVRSSPADSPWQIVEPYDWPAEAPRVEELLRRLVGLDKERTIEEVRDDELEGMGLASPRATLSLVVGEGAGRGETSSRILEVGAAVPASSQILVRLADNPKAEVFVTEGGFVGDLLAAPGSWRSKKLFDGVREEILSVTLVGGGRRLTVERDGNAYRLLEPRSDLADRDEANRLLDEILGLEARSFVDAPEALSLTPSLVLAPAGETGQGEVVVRFLGENQSPWTLTLGAHAPAGGRYAKLSADQGSQVVVVDDTLTDFLVSDLDLFWRAKGWTSFQNYEVERAHIVDSEGETALHRQGADWRRDGELISYSLVSELLTALANASATKLRDEPKPVVEPDLSVSLENRGRRTEDLDLYNSESRWLASSSTREGVVLELPAEIVEEILVALKQLREGEAEVIDPVGAASDLSGSPG